MHTALLVSIGVLVCLAALRLWVAHRLGELRPSEVRHARHSRPR